MKEELKNGEPKMNDSRSKLMRKDRRAIESKDGAIEDNINCKFNLDCFIQAGADSKFSLPYVALVGFYVKSIKILMH